MTSSPDPMGTPCAGMSDLFYSLEFDDQELAKTLCRTCLLRPLCLRKAIATNDTEGIWGGYDARERAYYRQLHGLPSTSVVELPSRLRTRPPKRKHTAA